MKIDLNPNGELYNTETGTAVKEYRTQDIDYTINNNGYGDIPEVMSKSKNFGKALSAVSDANNPQAIIESIKALIDFVEDESVKNGFEGRPDYLIEQAEGVNSISQADKIFGSGTHPMELSEAMVSYISNNSLATEVAQTNISTGVHLGNTPDMDAANECYESLNVLISELNTLLNDVDLVVNPDEDEYDEDYDEYDEDYDEDYEYDEDDSPQDKYESASRYMDSIREEEAEKNRSKSDGESGGEHLKGDMFTNNNFENESLMDSVLVSIAKYIKDHK